MVASELPANFATQLDAASEQKCVTLVFADSGYENVVQNWLLHAKIAGARNHLIVALDKPLHEKLQSQGEHSVAAPHPGSLDALWQYRVFCVAHALNLGYHICHSDADAVWLQDPTEDLLLDTTVDITFSQGTIWPLDVFEKWGFVLCCGLFGIRSTKASRAFVEDWLTAVTDDPDDQRSLNRLLMNRKVIWQTKPSRRLRFRDHDITCFEEPLMGLSSLSGNDSATPTATEKLTTKLLPHALYQRVLEQHPQPVVRHILSDEKNAKSVEEVLAAAGCWKHATTGALS